MTLDHLSFDRSRARTVPDSTKLGKKILAVQNAFKKIGPEVVRAKVTTSREKAKSSHPEHCHVFW
jgi:hypothetical protein